MPQVYLIHFDSNLHHARHYIGQSLSPTERLKRHKSGRSQVHILHACNSAGIGYNIVRTWDISEYDYQTRTTEKRLKAQHKSRHLCPVCNSQGWMRHEALIDQLLDPTETIPPEF